MVTCTERPDAMVPSAQFTVPASTVHEPAVGVALTAESEPGVASLRVTAEASEGPLLVTVTRYCTGRPATTGEVTACLVTTRSARGATGVTVTVAALFPGVGSDVAEPTRALLVRGAVVALDGTPATTVTCMVWPGSSPPAEHETWLPVTVHMPRSVTALRTVREEGRVSVTVTSVAREEPLLVAMSV